MPTDALNSRQTADACLSAVLTYQRLRAEYRKVVRDAALGGRMDVKRLGELIQQMGVELSEAKRWADHTYDVDAGFDTARRGAILNPTAHKEERLRAAELAIIKTTTNPATCEGAPGESEG